jgi:hypothetical protein
MNWEEPTFEEVNLDAEIGSYQSDFLDPQPPPDPSAHKQVPASTELREDEP